MTKRYIVLSVALVPVLMMLAAAGSSFGPEGKAGAHREVTFYVA